MKVEIEQKQRETFCIYYKGDTKLLGNGQNAYKRQEKPNTSLAGTFDW
jgi:hypothetical protein